MKFEDLPKEKRCTRCGETKPGDEFYLAKGRDNGFYLAPACSACAARGVELARHRRGLKSGALVLLPAEEVKRLYQRVGELTQEVKRMTKCADLVRRAALSLGEQREAQLETQAEQDAFEMAMED